MEKTHKMRIVVLAVGLSNRADWVAIGSTQYRPNFIGSQPNPKSRALIGFNPDRFASDSCGFRVTQKSWSSCND